MKTHLLNFLTLLSLLLLVAVRVMWVRSYRLGWEYAVVRQGSSHTYVVFSSGGTVRLIRAEWIDAEPGRFLAGGPANLVVAPYSLVTAALAALPAARLWRWHRLRRRGGPVRPLRVRSPRHARPLPRMRHDVSGPLRQRRPRKGKTLTVAPFRPIGR